MENILDKIILTIIGIASAIICFLIMSEIGYEEEELRGNCFIQRFWESNADFQKRCAE